MNTFEQTFAEQASPLVSVVVIGRNEGQRLSDCLASVRAANWIDIPYELIYVDSNSSDNSVARAKAAEARVLQVKPVRPSAATGRNAGWRAARGEFVLFLDGDTLLHPEFVGTALTSMRDPGVAVVWGHRRERATQASFYNRILDLDWVYRPGETEFCGGDALMRRASLASVNGYDESLIAGEEPELCRRLRARQQRILHPDIPMTTHDLAMHSFDAYWKRATRAGHAYAEISKRFSQSDDPFWLRESRQNLVRGACLVLGGLMLLLAFADSFETGVLAAVSFGLLGFLVILRTMKRNAWKSDDVLTLTLYAVHSHFQQLPIMVGQLMRRIDDLRGRQRGLIEYK